MKEIISYDKVPLTHIFDTTAMSDDENSLDHHHNYEYDIVMDIYTEGGETFELYNDLGLYEAERPNKSIIALLSIDNPGVLGIGDHPYEIFARDGSGNIILNENGTIKVLPTPEDYEIDEDRVMMRWDLLHDFDKVSRKQRDARLDTCMSCEKYDNGLCTACGCIMKWRVSLKDSSCPLHKWEE